MTRLKTSRLRRRVSVLIEIAALGLALLTAAGGERLEAQECPGLPIYGAPNNELWDGGVQSVGILRPTVTRDGLTLYFDANGAWEIWTAQRDKVEDPWAQPRFSPRR